MRNYLAFLSLIVFLFLSVQNTRATEFQPTKKQIEIIVPYPPGGATDRVARLVSEIFLEHGWKSTVLNQPGGETTIASNNVASAKPDGHTLYIGGNGFLDANIVFDAPGRLYNENSFDPVVPLGHGSLMLAVSNTSTVRTYEEFKNYVKVNPDKFKIGFWNFYTAHLFYEWARLEGLPKPTIVTYKGSAPQITDILGGHIEFIFDSFTATNKHYEADKLRIIASLDSKNLVRVQNIKNDKKIINISKDHPTLEISTWYGIFSPANTSQSVKQEIRDVVNAGFAKQKNIDRMAELGIFDVGGSAEQLNRTQKDLLSFFKDTLKNMK
jgi:tripartite-type tricarboxylate transporter receptor subunit TctC